MGIKINHLKFLRIAAGILVLLLICVPSLTRWYEKRTRTEELSAQPCYEVYFMYVNTRESYRLFLLCNPAYTVEEIITATFTESYFEELQSRIDRTGFGEFPATVYLMMPNDELPYGWEKSEANIAINFDTSVFHRSTISTVFIPYGAKTLQNCSVE